MATTKISATTSIVASAAGTSAFNSDLAGPDALIVDLDAYLVATNSTSNGARLGNNGAWTVTVNGTLYGAGSGIVLDAGNAALTTITVGAEGSIHGASDTGIKLGSPATIKNAGIISGFQGIYAGAEVGGYSIVITNSGTLEGMSGGDAISAPRFKLVNSGFLQGGLTGVETLSNTGTMYPFNVKMSDLTKSSITNSGRLNALTIRSSDFQACDINNRGTMVADLIYFTNSLSNSINNSGEMYTDMTLGFGTTSIVNSGYLQGNMYNYGPLQITNSGTIEGTVFPASGFGLNKITVINSGSFLGSVNFSDAADVFVNSGTISSVVAMGGGADAFTGGAKNETVLDGGGADIYKLGAGNDTYLAGNYNAADGIDVIDGGSGIDTFDASMTTFDLAINLDTIDHNWGLFGGGGVLVDANVAVGGVLDQITGFEKAAGGSGQNDIHGTSKANVIHGYGGVDRLFGYAGNDELIGGTDTDVFVGGSGADSLEGGHGFDFFSYSSIKDSGITKATRDIIEDFYQGEDVIDLFHIDANTLNGSSINDAFSYLGSNATFTGAAGQLRSLWIADGHLVQGDVNGDRKADFSIFVADRYHSMDLTGADFLL